MVNLSLKVKDRDLSMTHTSEENVVVHDTGGGPQDFGARAASEVDILDRPTSEKWFFLGSARGFLELRS